MVRVFGWMLEDKKLHVNANKDRVSVFDTRELTHYQAAEQQVERVSTTYT